MEVCSSCGDLVERLLPTSGWCRECSSPTCTYCGEEFDDYGQTRDLCPRCRRVVWDQEHADAIERFMASGLTLTKARQAVKQQARPKCLCCGEPILYGNPWRDRFCTRTSKCKQSARRYRYFKYEKRMTEEVALSLVIERLFTREIA